MTKQIKQIESVSLIELVVAIAIIGILAAGATIIYSGDINRSKVSSAVGTLHALENAAKLQYEAASTATDLEYGSITIPANTVTSLNVPPVVNALYIPPGTGDVDAQSFLVCVYVGQLDFDGYVAPTAGNAGSYSRMCRLVTAGNNVYTNRCGALDGSSADIPVTYLPVGCNCANVASGAC